jgi:UrcA family protein
MSRFARSLRPRLRTLAALAALTAVASLASPAVASAGQPSADVLRTTVYYSLHELATEQGTRALYQRIVQAARTVCPAGDPRDLENFSSSRECQRAAVARAIGQIGSARLAAVRAHALARRG